MSIGYSRQQHLSGINIAGYSVAELKKWVTSLLNDKIHGICFSPYIEGQAPGALLSEAQIRQRLEVVQPYVNWVRTFSCTQGNELVAKIAHQLGLKTLVGVWLDDKLENNELELKNALQLAKEGNVDLLAVGNEVLLRGELTAVQLVDYIQRAQQGVVDIEVGYVDAYFEFEEHPSVAQACDVIFANCYPFWEGYPAEHALVYMKDMYHRARQAAQDKKVIISETGWPNLGSRARDAIPSIKNAMGYFINTYHWAAQENIDIFYFSSFDETWKVEDEGDVGAYWGLWDKDGNLKYG